GSLDIGSELSATKLRFSNQSRGPNQSGLRLLKCPCLPSLELGVSWAAGLKFKHLQLGWLVLRVGGLLRPGPSEL
ncbi:hypothetical protein PIB30_089939, partial [Stylosanthes scabra]|nr:hypothetical protein [Stylosanthes scabra]